MQIDTHGDIITVQDFWDCECDNDFIHRKSEKSCRVCKANNEDMPDSMLHEILIEFGDKLDRHERAELTLFLAEKNSGYKKSEELTDAQSHQVDVMHNAAFDAMSEIMAPLDRPSPEWNMEWIGELCDDMADIAKRYFGVEEMEVYPYIDTE
jgi:hypothetical protein